MKYLASVSHIARQVAVLALLTVDVSFRALTTAIDAAFHEGLVRTQPVLLNAAILLSTMLLILGALSALFGSLMFALLISAILFALMHSHAEFVHFMVSGLFLGAIAIRSNSIWCSALAHAIYNLFFRVVFSSSALSSPSVLDSWTAGRFKDAFTLAGILVSIVLLWPIIKIAEPVQSLQVRIRRARLAARSAAG